LLSYTGVRRTLNPPLASTKFIFVKVMKLRLLMHVAIFISSPCT